MLPNFPKLKKEIYDGILIRILNEPRDTDSLLSRINKYTQHEGDKGWYQTVNGDTKQQQFERMTTEVIFTVEDASDPTLEKVADKFRKMGEEIASQQARYTFKTVADTVDAIGNTIEAQGEFTFEIFLQLIAKIQIDFDEQTGKAMMPTLYIHPSQSEKFQKFIKETENNLEYKKQYDELMKIKREEWNAREADRKLVD